MQTAKLYKKLTGEKVQCLACSHRCKILPNTMAFDDDRRQNTYLDDRYNTGICGVRANLPAGRQVSGGELQLLVYGRAIAANIDPIEKKPLYHFLPGSKIFSIGTVGCNFGCDFCQNADISQITKVLQSSHVSSRAADKAARRSQKEVASLSLATTCAKLGYKLPPKKIVEYCVEEKIPSIAFTYNEPTIFSEYAVDVMKLAKKKRIYGVYVSNGFFTKECFDFIAPHIGAFNIDLKSFSDDYYRKICKARLEPVLDSIKRVHKAKKHLEITTLVVPGKNDSKKELAQIAKFIAGVSKDIPWHISAFYPTYKMTDNVPTPEEKLFEAYEIGKKAGLNYVYTGNIADMRLSQTICPKCSFTVIARNGYDTSSRLKSGLCPNCEHKVYGIF